jgi:hypothetical protein
MAKFGQQRYGKMVTKHNQQKRWIQPTKVGISLNGKFHGFLMV